MRINKKLWLPIKHIIKSNDCAKNGDYKFYRFTGEFYNLGKYFIVSHQVVKILLISNFRPSSRPSLISGDGVGAHLNINESA